MARKYSVTASLAALLLALLPASALAKKSQTITVETPAPKSAFVGTSAVTKAKASSGLPVSVNTEETPTVCSTSGSTVTFKAAGSCHVDFNQAGSEEWAAAPEIKEFVEVTKRSQTISFTSKAPSNATINGPTYAVSATATSGQSVTFSSGTSSVCTVSGSTVSFVGAGTCTIDANQAGNTEYAAAPQATQSFAVAKRTQTIAFTSAAPSSATIKGPTYTVSATATSGQAVSFSSATSGVCTVSGSTVSFVGAGTCTIDANQAGNSEYEPAPQAQQSFAVAKRTQTTTFTSSPGSPTVGGTYAVSATASSGLAVSFSSTTTKVCTVSGSTVSFVAQGGCTLVAGQAGNAEYEPAPESTQTFTVAKRTQSVTFTSSVPSGATVGGASYTVSATASSGLAVSFSSANTNVCTVSGSTVSFVGGGTCTINANQAGNGEYEAAPTVQQSFPVAKGSQTITFSSTPPSSANVGQTYNVSATGGSSGNPVTFSDPPESSCTVSGSTVKLNRAGLCTINANQAGNEGYEQAPTATQSFAVTKQKQTISFTSTAPSNAPVGGPAYTVSATASSNLTVEITLDATSSGCTIAGATVSFTAVGTCKIDANQAGNANYEAAQLQQQVINVVKGSQTIRFTSRAGNTTVGVTYEVTATGGASGNDVTFTIDPASASVCSIEGAKVTFKALSPPACTIDANEAGDANYNAAAQVTQTYQISKGTPAISFSTSPPSPASPGGTYVVEATSSSSEKPLSLSSPTPTVCTLMGKTVSFVGTGECVIVASQVESTNYVAAQAEQKFIVASSSRPQTIPLPTQEGGSSGKTLPPIKKVGGPNTPDSNFKVIGASLSLATYAITFQEAVHDPGTFTWVLTFENGKFGVYSAKAKRCKAGFVRLKKKCRPSKILFGKGSQAVAAPGSVNFTVRPTSAGVAAMKHAFKQHKGLPVTALVTFQSHNGGPPATRVQSLIIKGRR
jgi:hypothetical protein